MKKGRIGLVINFYNEINSDYSAIQKFFKNIMGLPWNLKKLPRPRKQKKLPSILSKEDEIKIIESTHTYKQQVMFAFYYVTGVRLSEGINLKIDDVDDDCMMLLKQQLSATPMYFILRGRQKHSIMKSPSKTLRDLGHLLYSLVYAVTSMSQFTAKMICDHF